MLPASIIVGISLISAVSPLSLSLSLSLLSDADNFPRRRFGEIDCAEYPSHNSPVSAPALSFETSSMWN